MPSFFPEGNDPAPGDSPHRSLQKWNDLLFQAYGNVGSVPYPEGTEPKPGDNEHRSDVKINAILNSI